MRCRYCYENNKLKDNVSLLQVARILDKIYLNDPKPYYIEVFGGEPLMRWDAFLLVLHACQKRNTPIITSTNGIFLDDKKINILNKHNITVGISYDGQTSHDFYRKTIHGEDTEKNVRDAIVRSIKNNLDIIINIALQKANKDSFLDDITDLFDLGVDKIQIYNVNNNLFCVSEIEKKRILNQVAVLAKRRDKLIYLNGALKGSSDKHFYYYNSMVKIQTKDMLGSWEKVGWN
jgi:sulfatase maturation enzyme AslB (radical SAM superfamily)